MIDVGSGRPSAQRVQATACDIEMALEPPFPLEGSVPNDGGGKSDAPASPPAQETAAPQPVRKGKTWTVGTLTYTAGGLGVLFFWLLWGDFSWAMKERAMGPVLQILLKKFEASDFLAGLFMTSLPQMIALVLGPVISCWSDRCRSKWGRRIPFLLIPTPLGVIAMLGLAFSPVIGNFIHEALGLSPSSLNMVIVVMFGLFWTIFEFASITSNTVFGGLINDVVPHPVIGRFYGLFRAVSLIAGIIFNYILIGKAGDCYILIFLGLGSLYGVGFTAMCFKVKEGDYPTPPPLAGGGWHPLKSVKSYFKECFSIPYYCGLFAMVSFAALAILASFLFSVYAAQSFGLSMDKYGLCLAITYACSLVLTYPLGSLADRFHPLRVGLAMLVLHVGITLCGFLFINSPLAFSIIFIAQGVVAGSYGTATAGLLAMLLPKGRFSQFASACALMTSLGVMLLGPALGKLLDCNGHQYCYTFGVSCVFSLLALGAGLWLYRQFIALGGFKGYAAPEPHSQTVANH